jgi:hypothetical protein
MLVELPEEQRQQSTGNEMPDTPDSSDRRRSAETL